ncbi:MAG: ArsR family transcriptional regulator [Chloroflexi bacterium]|nr:ArsR family transcriptional regulator [Chloroflexota bacterium]
MDGTRLSILNSLQRHGATVDQLSTELGMAAAAVRRHLEILQRDRLVTFEPVRRKPGRPEHLFALTEEGQEIMPKRYNLLLQRLLHTLTISANGSGDAPAKQLLTLVARTMVEEHRARLPDDEEIDRITLLRRILEDEQFSPSVEVTPEGVQVTLHNCPYRGVATQSGVICTLDRELIAEVLEAPVSSTARINLGDPLCTYDTTPQQV